MPPWLLVSPTGSEDKGDLYLEPEEWEHLVFFSWDYTHTSLPRSFIISVKAASLNVTGAVRPS
jgi:hypothetical protein